MDGAIAKSRKTRVEELFIVLEFKFLLARGEKKAILL